MTNKKASNYLQLAIFCMVIGAVIGGIIWTFLKTMSLGIGFLWEKLPSQLGVSSVIYTIVLCTVGGLIIGLFRKKFGDYPEELDTVIGKVKEEKHYDYKNMLVMLIAAMMPLLVGASIGPEAGLTGIIVGLCYWAGDNLKFAGVNTKACTEVGTAVTLSVLFCSPLFGIFTVEEDDESNVYQLTKSSKIFLYGMAMVGGMGIFAALTSFFGSAMAGMPTFEGGKPEKIDYVMIPLYIAAGLVLGLIYEKTHKSLHRESEKMPPVVKETVAGALLGLVGAFVPMIMFSGEGEMHELMHEYVSFAPLALVGIAVLKILMTNICIQLGLKGGHFFPMIFAGVALGYGVAMFVFQGAAADHVVFAAAVVTAAMLGSVMKKPLAVSMLMFLCFPVKLFLWIFAAAVVGSKVFSRAK